jgi:hypothetical protein
MVVMMMMMMRVPIRPGARVWMMVMVATHHARTVHAGVQRTVAGPV